MNKAFISAVVFLLFTTNGLWAQSTAEINNKAVYNRLEYFFNSRQSDSIYAIANDTYKQKVNIDEVKQILDYFYQYGRIEQANLISFDQGVADYELKIGEKIAGLQLAVDSNFKYGLFQLSVLEKSRIQQKQSVEKAIVSKVEKNDILDFYIDSLARVYMQQPNTQSLSIGIVHNNQTKTFFYGETVKGDSTSLPNENRIYEIGGVTKTFTATLLADLVHRGTIRLEDSIAKFLPDSVSANPAVQGITFQSLANHTSGLPKWPSNMENSPAFNPQDPYAAYTRKDMFDFLRSFESKATPGEKYEYSELGYGLLGELLSMITKKTYGDLVKEIITTPLKMANTADKLNPKTQQLVHVYDENGIETSPWNYQSMAGAAALKSSVKDLLSYARIQFDIPNTSIQNALALTRQFTYFLPPDTDIGLAWRMNMLDDIIAYTHTGNTGGCRVFIGLIPDRKSALVVLTNSAVPVDEVCTKMLEKILATKSVQ